VAERARAGALIALEGADSAAVSRAGDTLHDALSDRKVSVLVSRWDASGLFGDIVSAPRAQRDLSPRTLLLLYAADLAFRLRWQIRPALDEGHVVVAVPYVLTATTFGMAAGLPLEWLETLFGFAPAPARTVILREPKGDSVWKRRPGRGFTESCTTLLHATGVGFARRKARAAMAKTLAAAAGKHGGLHRKRDVAALAQELIKLYGRRAAAPSNRQRAR
jgi:Thymidylate kinase